MERQLSAQDKLRLGVLATRNVRAIRIDEAAASLSALTDAGEARIPLNPGPDPNRYFRALREHLSELFLNLPGGYPAHIGRWTRMDSLHRDPARLLLLGDPEAVVAVAFADTLDARVAADVWWCSQSVEIALALLRHPGAADWPVGQELARFMLEHLPIEEDAATVAGALGRILQPGLVSSDRAADLWRRGRRRHPWRAGFFLGHPALYPDTRGEHPPGPRDTVVRARSGQESRCASVARISRGARKKCPRGAGRRPGQSPRAGGGDPGVPPGTGCFPVARSGPGKTP